MRIVNLDDFLKLPVGTLFSKYQPIVLENLCIKGESILETKDFYFQSLNDSIECSSSEEFHDLFMLADKNGIDLLMNFHYEHRDGMYDEKQLFAVFVTRDFEQLLDRLKEAYKSAN